MKAKIIICISFLSTLLFVSCSDEGISKDMSGLPYVRINERNITVGIGESYIIRPLYDGNETAAKNLTWTVMNPEIASVISGEDNCGILKGLSVGKTIIKVESEDKQLRFFTDVTVRDEDVVKILTIGDNSSKDAVTPYLLELAKNVNIKMIIGNITAKEGMLRNHWDNATKRSSLYLYKLVMTDGSEASMENVTLGTIIKKENWSYISLEESLPFSGIIDGYRNYLPAMLHYLDSLATNPDMKILLHQPWAYSTHTDQLFFEKNYDSDQEKMFNAIVNATDEAGKLPGIYRVIPSGTAIQNGRTSYLADPLYLGDQLTKADGYSLSDFGKFIAAATWYETIFGTDATQNDLVPASLVPYDANLAKTAAHSAITTPKEVTELTSFKFPPTNEFILEYPVFIDFGNKESPPPFNNYRNPQVGKLGSLKDAQNNNTGFAIEAIEGFTGQIYRPSLPNNTLGFPKEVSDDFIFADGKWIPRSVFLLSNLNKTQKYTFVFYGYINDEGVESEFNVIGKNRGMVRVVNTNNTSEVGIVRDIQPDDYGNIQIVLSKGPNNTQFYGFYGLNAMIIGPEGYTFP